MVTVTLKQHDENNLTSIGFYIIRSGDGMVAFSKHIPKRVQQGKSNSFCARKIW